RARQGGDIAACRISYRTPQEPWAQRCCSQAGPGSAGNLRTSDSSGLVQRLLLTRLPPRLGLSFLLAVSFRPRRRGESFDRRLTRLTLRPEPSVTFSRIGTRQEVVCEDAQIGQDAVHLRCELERVGVVTIDGRFTSRFVTSSLDTPVLSALITITNTRGETLFSARESFYWHAPD